MKSSNGTNLTKIQTKEYLLKLLNDFYKPELKEMLKQGVKLEVDEIEVLASSKHSPHFYGKSFPIDRTKLSLKRFLQDFIHSILNGYHTIILDSVRARIQNDTEPLINKAPFIRKYLQSEYKEELAYYSKFNLAIDVDEEWDSLCLKNIQTGQKRGEPYAWLFSKRQVVFFVDDFIEYIPTTIKNLSEEE